MLIIFFNLLITLFLSSIVMKISLILSKKINFDYEKLTPFECGFDPINSSRLPLSIRFFLITIIFLIFDVEIALLMPVIKSFYISNMKEWLITSNLIITILIFGLYLEWKNGALNWTN